MPVIWPKLYCGDCLEILPKLPSRSVDLILADPPYGSTACKWDAVIEFEPMWSCLKRLVKEGTAILLFGQEPFSSLLRLSNLKMYKYDWIWDKKIPYGMSYAKHRPMGQTELISVFSVNKTLYNPQMTLRDKPIRETTGSTSSSVHRYSKFNYQGGKVYTHKNPTTLLSIPKVPNSKGTLHPSQKPVELIEYLVRTYSNEGDTVLDFCMGSGTTGVACKNLNRRFIGIEKDPEHFETARERIRNA